MKLLTHNVGKPPRNKELKIFLVSLLCFFSFLFFFLVCVWVGGGVCLLLELGEVKCTVSLYSSLSCFVKSLPLSCEIQKLMFFFFQTFWCSEVPGLDCGYQVHLFSD